MPSSQVHGCAVLLRAQVTSNQPVDLVIIGDEGTPVKPFEVAATKGTTTLCLPGSGNFLITPKGCYIFSSKSYSVTASPEAPVQPLKLTATRAYVDGLVKIAPPSGQTLSPSSLPGSIDIGTITAEPADSVSEAGVVASATQLNPENQLGVYSYTLALDLGSTVMIEPVQPDGGSLIFVPARTRYHLGAGAKGCPDAVPDITAHEGVLVSGQTEPAVAGERHCMAATCQLCFAKHSMLSWPC